MELGLHIDLGEGAGDVALDAATRQLAAELTATRVDRVSLVEDTAPDGTKGSGLAVLGSLILQFVNTGALAQIADVVIGWVQRDKHRAVKLTDGDSSIELTEVSAEDQREALTAWLAAMHARSSCADA